MADAWRVYPDRTSAQAPIDEVNTREGYPKRHGDPDTDPDVTATGGGRHVPVTRIRTDTHGRVEVSRDGTQFAIRVDDKVRANVGWDTGLEVADRGAGFD